MRCERVSFPGGGTAFVCRSGRQPMAQCSCGAPATLVCDYPLKGEKAGKTCDRDICRACAASQGPNIDWCPAHARLPQERTVTELVVATARISYGGPDRIDVTRKSGESWARAFAPSWAILRPALAAREQANRLMGKARQAMAANEDEWGPMREAERIEADAWAAYVPAYLAEMRRSYVERRADWDMILSAKRAVVVCYCEDYRMCHRTILARDVLPKLGAKYEGELPR